MVIVVAVDVPQFLMTAVVRFDLSFLVVLTVVAVLSVELSKETEASHSAKRTYWGAVIVSVAAADAVETAASRQVVGCSEEVIVMIAHVVAVVVQEGTAYSELR